MISLGVDIGLSGALAVVRGDELLGLEDMPTRERQGTGLIKREVDPRALREAILRLCGDRKDEAIACCLENVYGLGPSAGGEKRHGVSGAFAFGQTRGAIGAVIEILGLKPDWVAPQTWKRAFGLYGQPDKNASRRKAQEMYPAADLQLVKHHNRAEALLIARFAWNRNA